MKSSITIPCSCGKQLPLEFTGSELPRYAKCISCGAAIHLFAPLGSIATLLLIERARRELSNEDVTMAVLLGAMSVEAEMSYLFLKWKGIDSGKLPFEQTKKDRNQWEEEWANMRSIGKRMDDLSRLLTGVPFDEFACLNKATLMPAITGYRPAISFKDFFQESLFEKRNDIVHYGNVDLQKADGQQCLSLASALLTLLKAMDTKRIRALDEAHKKTRE
jgi:hypothetical protein